MGIPYPYSTGLPGNSQWDIMWEKGCKLEGDTNSCYCEEPDIFGQPANLSLASLFLWNCFSLGRLTSKRGLKQKHKHEKGRHAGRSVNGLACEGNVSRGRISAKRKVFAWCRQSRVTKCRLALPGLALISQGLGCLFCNDLCSPFAHTVLHGCSNTFSCKRKCTHFSALSATH